MAKARGTAPVVPAGPCVACKSEGTERINTFWGVLCSDAVMCGHRYRGGRTHTEYAALLKEGKVPA